jgi:hypothetical protein
MPCDADVPFAKEGSEPAYHDQIKALFGRHQDTTIIWAHTGMGRVVRPIKDHTANLEAILRDARSDMYFDISWDEVAKYIVSSTQAVEIAASLINRYPERFLFGTDEVAPKDSTLYTRVFGQYAPLWKLLVPDTSRKVRLENYTHLFDTARSKVRTWESTHAKRTGS